VEELGLDEPPVLLYPPNEWSRHTPIESYKEGSRLFGGIAHLLGGAPQMRAAMASWYQRHAGGFVTTDGLERHLNERAEGVSALFKRYVHGQAEHE
jgi:aminopeptidase N